MWRFFPVLLLIPAFALSADLPDMATSPLSAKQARHCQQTWSTHLGVSVEQSNSLGMHLMLIPPGRFTMGSAKTEEWHRDDEVLHDVTLTHAFYMASTEVSQGQWKAVMEKNPSFFIGDDLPVETVTWEDAAEFCRRLSQREGKTYRLPTEAEWEYACRAGTTTPFSTGATITPHQANYDGRRTYGGGPQGVFREETVKVGTLPSNAWGLCEMHGNVWEWCADWYAEYPHAAVIDPKGPAKGERRVFRGGCWINFPAVCRSANRAKVVPLSWNFHLGFRVVCELN